MMRFSGFIVKNRKHVLALFFLLLIPSVLGFLNTKENYDIMSYLPASLNSRQGEAILEEKFNLSGQAFVVLENTEAWKIRELKSRMEAVEGVKQVLWLDDFEDVNLPLEFMEPQIRDNFISGDSTILLIQFTGNARSGSTMLAVEEIREICGGKVLFGGEPVIMNDLQAITSKEMIYYMIIGVVSIYAILSAS